MTVREFNEIAHLPLWISSNEWGFAYDGREFDDALIISDMEREIKAVSVKMNALGLYLAVEV